MDLAKQQAKITPINCNKQTKTNLYHSQNFSGSFELRGKSRVITWKNGKFWN
jgi:hypothetical protein